jgi:hypothetical protein
MPAILFTEVAAESIVGIDYAQIPILNGQEAWHDVSPRSIGEELPLVSEQEETNDGQVRS